MQICIVSDSHDRSDALAGPSPRRRSPERKPFHCGDLIGANTLRASITLGLPLHVVHGNNVGDPMAMHNLAARSGGLLRYYGQDAWLELGGRKIFVTHYPHYGHAMACTGDYDLVCHGHSHTAHVHEQPNIRGGRSWLVNPGSVAWIDAPGVNAMPTWILGDLDKMSFEIRRLAE